MLARHALGSGVWGDHGPSCADESPETGAPTSARAGIIDACTSMSL
jgi:hypothetical protein